MSYVRVAGTAKFINNGGTTAGIDTTGANLLIAFIGWFNGFGANPSLTDSNSNTWTALTNAGPANSNMLKGYYCYNPVVGAGHTFTVSTGSFQVGSVAVEAWSGARTSPKDQQVNNNNNGSGPSCHILTLTPSESDCLLISAVVASPSVTISSIDQGYTISGNTSPTASPGRSVAVAYLVETTAVAKDPTWTFSGNSDTTGISLSFFPTAGAPPAATTKALAALGVG